MLLPSALTCDSTTATTTSTQPKTRTRYQSALFASPPLSPTLSSSTHPAISNLYSTCRALQSMLAPPAQLPSPPTTHSEPALSSPFKLRLRSRGPSAAVPRKITKRAPPRGVNKRRRAVSEDLSRESADDEDYNNNNHLETDAELPSTPKRVRIAPEVIPMGLEHNDFLSLQPAAEITARKSRPELGLNLSLDPSFDFYSRNQGAEAQPPQSQSQSQGEEHEEEEEEEWTSEDDRILVELVLEKLKLTKSDWQDCARNLGKDRATVGRRWKSLMGAGEVGLKTRGRMRRGNIHATWR